MIEPSDEDGPDLGLAILVIFLIVVNLPYLLT